jgi:hypothetical protein
MSSLEILFPFGKKCKVFFGKKWYDGKIHGTDCRSASPISVHLLELDLVLSFGSCEVHTNLEAWEEKYGAIWQS